MKWHEKVKLIEKIRADVDLERLTDLLADDYLLQQAAGELQESVENAEKRKA